MKGHNITANTMAEDQTLKTDDQVAEYTPSTDTTPDEKPELENPAGLLSTLEKYKKYGSVKDLEAMRREAQRMELLESAIKEQGIDAGSIPTLLQDMRAREERQKEYEEQYKLREERMQLEFQQQLANANKQATEARTALLEKERADQIVPHFLANARPEAAEEWSRYWEDIKRFIEFEPDGATVKQILGKDGKPVFLNTPGEEVRAATVTDLFNGIIDGKYGYLLQSALKPASAASGGGAVRPTTGAPGGPVRVDSNTDYGKMSSEQLAQIRQQNYQLKR